MSFLTGLAGRAITSAVPSLLGGLLGPDADDVMYDQLKMQRKLNKMQLKFDRRNARNVVKSAQQAGFNPLTLLGATGGRSAMQLGSHPAPGLDPMADAITQGATNAAQTILNYDPIAEETAKLELQIRKQELANLKQRQAQNAVPSVSETPEEFIETLKDSKGIGGVRPVSREDVMKQRIPVREPDGTVKMMLKSTANRLGFNPYHQLTQGEYAEVMGELTEVTNLFEIDSVYDAQLGSPNPIDLGFNINTKKEGQSSSKSRRDARKRRKTNE